MIAALIAGLLPFALPWDQPPPPPEEAELVLTQPALPDPPPDGSVIDLPGKRELPLDWRTSESAARTKENAGLDELNASGSGQFCRDQFFAMRAQLRGRNVVLVDLRQEPHTQLDGAAVSWGPPAIVGTDRTASEIMRAERSWTEHLMAGKFATLTQYAPGIFADTRAWEPIRLKLDLRDAITEDRLAVEAGWAYFRIAASDTIVPRDQDVDRLVAFARNLEEGRWLHFHCDTGGNRTTLFLTLYDMMRNYMRVSRHEIIERQRKLGGIDLLAGPRTAKAERAEFLERFFSYCWQCGPQFRRSWSSWSCANPGGGAPTPEP